MTDTFRLTMAQMNPVLGDLQGNAAKALAAWEEGRAAGAHYYTENPPTTRFDSMGLDSGASNGRVDGRERREAMRDACVAVLHK